MAFSPPHDCRLTYRCLHSAFGFRLEIGTPFESLRRENSYIDTFFERRQNDPAGGERGERIQQIRSRPAYSLHYRRLRGATWFDTTQPPQGVVWLLGADIHDERHKGRSDVYDVLGELDDQELLFPQPVDYKRLELDRRVADTATFADDVREDARSLVAELQESRRAEATLAGVRTRAAWTEAEDSDITIVYVGISTEASRGPISGYEFPLTEQRFLLLAQALTEAAEEVLGREVLTEERNDVPGKRQDERGLILVFESQ
jgi:hypothetical protein